MGRTILVFQWFPLAFYKKNKEQGGTPLRDAMDHWLLYTKRVLLGHSFGHFIRGSKKRHHQWSSDVVMSSDH